MINIAQEYNSHNKANPTLLIGEMTSRACNLGQKILQMEEYLFAVEMYHKNTHFTPVPIFIASGANAKIWF